MKKLLLLLSFFSIIGNAQETLEDALVGSKLSLDGRLFYFDRIFDKPHAQNSDALTLGGIAKIETQEFYGAKIGAAYYGSYLLNMTQRRDGISSGLLEQNTGNNISFLGELYYQQTVGKTTLKIGRQRLFTPLANDHDLRLLPSSYEAIVLTNNDMPYNTIELGYIKRYTGFVSKYNTFSDEGAIWGKRGLPYIYLQNTSLNNTIIRAQYIKALDTNSITVGDYRYIDAAYTLSSIRDTVLKVQYGGNDYVNANNSLMYGALAQTSMSLFDFGAVYNKISGNDFKAIESGVMYTDWQQGYANYEPSEAIGGFTVIKPTSQMSLKIGKVWVRALNTSKTDDFSESNIDFWYTMNKNNKLRLRYSDKVQTPWTTRESRQDMRAIYYFSFAN